MKQPKHYTSIDDLPQYNWRMISEKNDLSFLLINKHQKFDKVKIGKVFEQIKDEYIDTFGINENYKKILELKKNIACLELEMAATGERFIKNHIKIATIELNSLLKATDKSKPYETTVRLSKHMGFAINERTISVREYAEMVEVMRNDLTPRKAA